MVEFVDDDVGGEGLLDEGVDGCVLEERDRAVGEGLIAEGLADKAVRVLVVGVVIAQGLHQLAP